VVNSANSKATINSEIIQDFIVAFFNGFCYFYLRSVATLLDELIMLFLSDEYIRLNRFTLNTNYNAE
jgi:hypothetical protein